MTFWAFLIAALGIVYFAGGIAGMRVLTDRRVRRAEARARAAEDDFVAWAVEVEPGTPNRL